jgi:type VI protein secretion system component VasF
MKLPAILRTAINIPRYIYSYPRERWKRRLYKQWIEKSDMPPETIRREEAAEEVRPRIYRKRLRMYVLFTLLGAALVIVIGGLILLLIRSC